MVKKSGLVDKLVAKKKKKRELCLDLNSGSGMFVNKSSTTTSIVDDILKVKQSDKPKKLKAINPISNSKEFAMFNIDNKTNFDDLQFSSNKKSNKDDFKKPSLNKNTDIKDIQDIKLDYNNINKIDETDDSYKLNINNKLDNNIPNIPSNSNTKKSNIQNSIIKNNDFIKSNTSIISDKFNKLNNKNVNNDNVNNDKNIKKLNKKSSQFSNSNIINLSKQKYNKLLEKEEALMKKIQYKNNQIEKMKNQKSELKYIKKSDNEKRKLVELEKQLHKIEKIKFLHQKKLSIEKYKQNIEQYNNMILKQNQNKLEFNKKQIEYNNTVNSSNNNQLNSNKQLSSNNNQLNNNNKQLSNNNIIKPNNNFKIKKLITPDYNIDLINKTTTSRNLLYNQIINKYKNNLLCIKNIENNKYLLKNNYFINNIERLVNILDISEKYWNTIYNVDNFKFILKIK